MILPVLFCFKRLILLSILLHYFPVVSIHYGVKTTRKEVGLFAAPLSAAN